MHISFSLTLELLPRIFTSNIFTTSQCYIFTTGLIGGVPWLAYGDRAKTGSLKSPKGSSIVKGQFSCDTP